MIRNIVKKIDIVIVKIMPKRFKKYTIASTINKIRRRFSKGLPFFYDKLTAEDSNIFDLVKFEEMSHKKFFNLIDGLDNDSIEVVVGIINRVKIILNTKARNIDLFTDDEKRSFKELSRDIMFNYIKVGKLFYYKKLFFPIDHFDINVLCYKHGLDFVKTLDKIGDKSIIDAGAFIGDSALVLSKYTKGDVYSFEPVSSQYELLLKTIELNGAKNIKPIKTALSNFRGKLKMTDDGSSSHNDNHASLYESVACDTLDNYVKENGLIVGMIKADIEGSEQLFLEGAIETIKKYKPILIISLYHNIDDFFDIKPKIDALGLGYKFQIYRPNISPRTIILETTLIAEIIE